MEFIHGGLKTLLVDHPTIANFEWKTGTTLGSTPKFLLLTVLSYLSFTFLLLKFRPPPPPPPPVVLRAVSILHNLAILLLSAAMAAGCSLSALSALPDPTWLLCFPENQIPRRGPLFFWAYVFYLSKILEFADTFLIIVSGSIRRLSILHVYHHATVIVMCYVWLETAQSLFPVALVTNATVHTVMYSYYLACAAGMRPPWKRAVTDFQIGQFLFSLLVSGGMLYLHFTRGGCSGIYGWCFNAVFNVSLLYLFLDFHNKNYKKKNAGQEREVKDKAL